MRQLDFDERITNYTNATEWALNYPLSVFCKNFENITDKEWMKRLLINSSASVKSIAQSGRRGDKNNKLSPLYIKVPCIPAMILPLALDPNNYVRRLLLSIDHCISTLYIFKSDKVSITQSLDLLDRKLVHNIVVKEHTFPIRVSQGWNSVMNKQIHPSFYLSHLLHLSASASACMKEVIM
jgi:hypothetical protein